MLPIIGDLITAGLKIIDKVIPDPQAKAAAQLELLKLQQSGELAQLQADLAINVGQLDANKAEAANPSVFVSGWRPFIGWVCGAACAWNWIGLPIALFVANYAGQPLTLKPADLTEMLPLLMGMLGLGGLRTVEKINGVARQ